MASIPLGVRLDERRAVLLATALSAILHLLMAGSLPLIITPDGGEYIRTALDLGKEGAPWSPVNRTPGYPVILYATFALFGVGAGGILIVQNLLAVATCALIALAACRIAGPRIGLAVGVLYAVEPWSLALANYALTETATVFLVVLAATLVVVLRRATVRAAVALGLALAAACMMRPSIALLAGFFALAWILGVSTSLRSRATTAAIVALAFLAAAGPFLAYNAARGVRGFAAGSDWVLWYGVTMFGLLDRADAPDPALQAVVDRNLAGGIADYPVMRAIIDAGALDDVEQGRRLGAWARRSVVKQKLAYLASVPYALLWQMNAGIAGRPPIYDELPFFLERLTWDAHEPARSGAPNFQNPGPLPRPWAFSVAWHGGVMQAYLGWVARGWLRGIPQLPLLGCALLTVVVAARRRAWAMALVVCGTLAFLLAHALLLLPIARHAMPVWTVWYLALAYLLDSARALRPDR